MRLAVGRWYFAQREGWAPPGPPQCMGFREAHSHLGFRSHLATSVPPAPSPLHQAASVLGGNPPPHPHPKAASAPLQDLLPWEHFLAVLPAGGARLLLCSTPRRLACVCPCPPALAQPPLAASLLPSSCSAAGQLCFWHFPLAWGCYGPNCVSQRSYWNPQSDGIWRWTVGEARVR